MLAWIARDWDLIPHKGTEIFRSCHLFNPLLHFVPNVISELKMHEDMLSPWRGECDLDQCPWWSSGYDALLDSERLGFDP